MTDAQLEQLRYLWLFDGLAAQERAAREQSEAGHSDLARAFRGYFVDKSGLTPEEADAIKRIGAKYLADKEALEAQYRTTLMAVRHANPGVHMSRYNSPELAAAERQMADLLPNTKAEIIAQIGPRSFTRLDSYMIHGSGLPDGSGASAISDQYQTQAQKFVALP